MASTDELNIDLAAPLCIDSAGLDWAPSPAAGVTRKRLYRAGPQESGRVTSLVRYAPGSRFHGHPHPEGEEILVLSGVFSDERGHWPAGSYLLNPEGFVHAPFSEHGCTLFVRLRQAPGRDRRQVGLLPEQRCWRASTTRGRSICLLFTQDGYADSMHLERWGVADSSAGLTFPDGGEVYVVNGSFDIDAWTCPAGCWLRLPPGSASAVRCIEPGELYIRAGAFAYLN